MLASLKQEAYCHTHRVFYAVFFSMLLISFMIVLLIENSRIKLEKNQMEYLVLSKSNKINEAIVGLLYKVEALSALVIQGNGEIQDFEKIAAILIDDPSIKNVLIAPQGIVTSCYPLYSNETLIGYNLFGEGEGNKEALLAKETGNLTLGGPFSAVQGGQILVGRLPVYTYVNNDKQFWGIVSVTLRYPQALASVYLEDIEKMGFACQIWRINPDTGEKQVILHSTANELENPIERKFNILNAEWLISIASIDQWYERISTFFYIIGSLFMSGLTAFMAKNYCETKRMKNVMEEMAMRDTLTGLPNRRSLFEKLKDTIYEYSDSNRIFALGYLDLNDFKGINDTYGHKAGDLVLIETARIIKKCIGKEEFVSRIGGDEFIILLSDIQSEGEAIAIFNSIEVEIKNPFFLEEDFCIIFSATIGYAFFPKNGTNIEELTVYADEIMYSKKEKKHSTIRKRP